MSNIPTQNIQCTKGEKKCRFVKRSYAKENRKGIFDVLNEVRKHLKEKSYPGFSCRIVGSSKRNMIYIKSKNDSNFDHDIQIEWNSTKNPIENFYFTLRDDFAEALKKKVGNDFQWEIYQSTKVITLKKIKENSNGKLLASFDLALIDKIKNKILVMDKNNNNNLIWNELGNVNDAYLKAKDLDVNDIKQEYIDLKHDQKVQANFSKDDIDYKSSSSLFIEAVNIVDN